MITNRNSINEAKKALRLAEKARLAAEASLRAAEASAIQEPGEGMVIAFDLVYPYRHGSAVNGKEYHYVGIRINNRWFLTGGNSDRNGMTWDDLLAFISRNTLVDDRINVATDWAAIDADES